MRKAIQICAGALAAGLASLAPANVTLQSQQRSITVATSSNGSLQTVSAPDFAPFVQVLGTSTTFPGAGGSLPNTARGRIDCQIDPNALRAIGTLAGAGGTLATTGETEIGDSRVSILVTFQVTSPLPFNLSAAPRPDLHPTDEFVIEFKDLTRNDRLVSLDQTVPAQQVGISGTLQPGQYSIKYRVEATFDGEETTRGFSFDLELGCPADFNGVGGVTTQDIFAFLNAWFAGDQRADFDHSGQIAVQDIFAFLSAWFAGCP